MTTRRSKLSATAPLFNVFARLEDPRSAKSQRHPFAKIIVIAVCGVICGADNWVAIESWAKANRKWLDGFLDMTTGIPSHDTLGRVFSILSPTAFQGAFAEWVQGLAIDVDGRVVAVDGKTARRSHDKKRGVGAIHMVNAWCTELGVSMGQVKTDGKSNEITAIPELLAMLKLDGAIVTTDAMGCQKTVAEAIRRQDGDYLLAVKDNHPTMCAEIKERFDAVLARETPIKALRTHSTSEKGHGREEVRTTYVLPAPMNLHGRNEWKDLKSIVMVEALRTVGEKTTCHHRFYISSMSPVRAEHFHKAARAHWGVENGLHWVLDVAFREDECRVRTGHGPENLARLRQIALNLLKQERSTRLGIKNKRLRAGWDEEYLRLLLGLHRRAGDSAEANG